MEKYFCEDSMSPTTVNKFRDYLYSKLKTPLSDKRPIIFLCIGTDRSTGDSLGPLIGYKLKLEHKNNIYVYGSLETPIHSKNLVTVLEKIEKYFINPYIIAIDSSLGNIQNVGKIFIEEKPLTPGLALNKDLPAVGDLSITGVVNISGNLEFIVLQNTRLFTVMSLADCITDGIKKCLDKISIDFSSNDRFSSNNLNKKQIKKG